MQKLCCSLVALSLLGSAFAGEVIEPIKSTKNQLAQYLSVEEMNSIQSAKDEVAIYLSKGDVVPDEVKYSSDCYFSGYLQALIDTSYSDQSVIVFAKTIYDTKENKRVRKIYLTNMPKNEMLRRSVQNFVKDVKGVDKKEVYILEDVPPEEAELREQYVSRPKMTGVWFPQMTELFQPLIADPRNVTYILGYRSGDHVIGTNCINIALGDDFGVYRWVDVLGHGDIQVGIESGIWSVFNLSPSPNPFGGTELVNTDFYFGIPITYAKGKWSFRLRGYHISSHLGDEYMQNHPETIETRVNPSVEAVDFFSSYQITEAIRLYVGPGAYVHSDPTYRWQPMYIEYGTEARFLGHRFYNQKMHGTLFFAMHWRNLQQLHWNFDGTYRAGYEFSKIQGVGRKFRAWAGYHHGYSLEGQFQKLKTHYWEFDINYGF